MHAQSAGEDSNSSGSDASDHGDIPMDSPLDSLNGSLDQRHSYPSNFMGLSSLMAGPSGIHNADFGKLKF